MLTPLEAACLSALPGVRHGFFTRAGGVSNGLYASLNCGLGSRDDPKAVLENRARAARRLGAAGDAVVTLYQVHGTMALVVDGPAARGGLPKADAVVTKTPGLAIGVLTADCAPVLFAAPGSGVVAAAHAGWRGASGGILEATLGAMERLGADRADIRAAIGPCINQAAYEVGPEFEAEVLAKDASGARFFTRARADARPRFDLPAYAAHRLTRAGVTGIERQTPCTRENESNFFSFRRSQHRKEPDYGRQISVIVVL